MNNKTIDLPAWAHLGIHVDEENHPQLATFSEANGFLDEQNRADFGDNYEKWGEYTTRIHFMPEFDDNDDDHNLVVVVEDMMNSVTVHENMLQAADSLLHDGFYDSEDYILREDGEDEQAHTYKNVLQYLRRCDRSRVMWGLEGVEKRLASECEINENE